MPADVRDEITATEARLAEVMADYVAEAEAGRPPDRAALLAAHPDLADDLAAFFRDHDRLLRLTEPLRAAAPDLDGVTLGLDALPTASLSDDTPRDFGDYELIEELARG